MKTLPTKVEYSGEEFKKLNEEFEDLKKSNEELKYLSSGLENLLKSIQKVVDIRDEEGVDYNDELEVLLRSDSFSNKPSLYLRNKR